MNLIYRVATRYLHANTPNVLDGLDRRQALNVVNKAIQSAGLNGFFNDQYWAPVQRIWKALDKAGVHHMLEKTWYDKDANGNPSSKTWAFVVEWTDAKGKPQKAHGRVVASGGGSVQEPLDRYDVTAYVS